jgi:hypothetical protein
MAVNRFDVLKPRLAPPCRYQDKKHGRPNFPLPALIFSPKDSELIEYSNFLAALCTDIPLHVTPESSFVMATERMGSHKNAFSKLMPGVRKGQD